MNQNQDSDNIGDDSQHKTPIGRELFAFRTNLYGHERDYFLRPEYIEGLAHQKDALHKEYEQSAGHLIIISTILISYVSGIEFNIRLLGFEISKFPSIIEILIFISANLFLRMNMRFIDFMLLDQILNIEYPRFREVAEGRYLHAHVSSRNIWSQLFVPRHYGYSSSKTHKRLVKALSITFMALGGFVAVLCLLAIIYASYFVFFVEKSENLFIALAVIGDMVALISIILPIYSLHIKFEYRFRKP